MHLWIHVLAQSSPALWNISVYSTGDSGIALDWYGYPPDLDIAFFILSVNQTTISPYHDDHDDDDRQLLRILRTFNSSESTFIMKELPAATEFAAVVYIVDKNNEIIKSERRTFGTEEGGTRFLFHVLTIPTMQQKISKQGKKKQTNKQSKIKRYIRRTRKLYPGVSVVRIVWSSGRE